MLMEGYKKNHPTTHTHRDVTDSNIAGSSMFAFIVASWFITMESRGADLTNVCPDVCVKDSETDPF